MIFQQSYKKVINHAPTARAAASAISHAIVVGTDSVAAGQTGPTDTAVPTGSVIKWLEIQYAYTNLVAVSLFHHSILQLARSQQANIDPLVVGGNNARNTVVHQELRSLGKEQNGTIKLKIRIPKIYQRIREGDFWTFITNGSAVYTDAVQVIYKFYR